MIKLKEKHIQEHSELAERIHRWRIDKKLSQQELALKSNIGRSTLSKIENEQLSPTFEILLKISRGFGVDVSTLLASDKKNSFAGRVCVDQPNDQNVLEYKNNKMFPLAAQLKGKSFECFVVEFNCFRVEEFGEWNEHNTEDFLYVLSGELEFHNEAYDTIHLTEGQSVSFDGSMPHACISKGNIVCKCLYVFANK
ncbi:MAG: helix-turn-helix transcriptional regulator [Kordiimonadaceae bacterium]|jgi:transcriptional regulator with XRE-family HTH domain|nr:helix-turn-helix transcriptional regulator [Kordiimonadaceae bacterium]MBT6031455.1 helix-turn-helix transcriptional regulator [Kordiimonadaceae bacterium]